MTKDLSLCVAVVGQRPPKKLGDGPEKSPCVGFKFQRTGRQCHGNLYSIDNRRLRILHAYSRCINCPDLQVCIKRVDDVERFHPFAQLMKQML